MAEPAASDAARALYDALAPAFTEGDEDRDWIALKVCMALTAPAVSQIFGYVNDQADGTPGWAIVMNPDEAPVEVLPWLAQFNGAKLRDNMTEAEKRSAIALPEGWERGTLAAIRQTVERRLTGTKTVLITERYTGSAWRVLIETLPEETADQEAIERELAELQKPIGIIFFFNERPTWDWDEVLAESVEYPDWDAIEEAFSTWDEFRVHEP